MNFYEFYQLLKENTVAQELKKYKQVKIIKEKETIKILFEEIKKVLFGEVGDPYAPNTLQNLKEDGKNIITNWVLFRYLKNFREDSGWVKWMDKATGKTDKKSAEAFLDDMIAKVKKNVNNMALYVHYDYLAANIDATGNLNPQLASKFNNPGFNIVDLSELDRQYHEELKQNKRMPGRSGKTILEFDDGYKWVDIERGYCQIEGGSMGHCGNIATAYGDTILSLRDKKNIPHLTFVLNKGVLGERKGVGNSKPAEKYHKYIIELLKLPIIDNLGRGRYLPENDFHLKDLNKQQLEDLLKAKPMFKGPMLLDNFEQILKVFRGNILNAQKELLKIPEFHVFCKYINFFKGSGDIDSYLSENEMLELIKDSNILLIEKHYRSNMGEKLNIYSTIAALTKRKSVHNLLFEKERQEENTKDEHEVYLSLASNRYVEEDIHMHILKRDVSWTYTPVLAKRSRNEKVLEGVYDKVIDLLKSPAVSNYGVEHVLKNLKNLFNNPYISEELKIKCNVAMKNWATIKSQATVQ